VRNHVFGRERERRRKEGKGKREKRGEWRRGITAIKPTRFFASSF
jgi:hypothetical protein